MNEKYKTLLFYLNSAGEALTTNEIYGIMTEEDKDQYHSPGEISKHLNNLREQKQWVSNGIEQKHKNTNRTFLTWLITTEGRLALEAHTHDTPNTHTTLPDLNPHASTEQPITKHLEISDHQQPSETIEIDDPLAFYDSVHDSVRTMLEMLLNNQVAITIQRKQGKIEVLEYFQKFAQPLNADFATVLGDIIQDLQKLSEA